MYLFMQVWDMRTKACIHTLTGHTNTVGTVFTQAPNPQVSHSHGPKFSLVSCPAHARLPARSSLVNEVKFLGLITQNG